MVRYIKMSRVTYKGQPQALGPVINENDEGLDLGPYKFIGARKGASWSMQPAIKVRAYEVEIRRQLRL